MSALERLCRTEADEHNGVNVLSFQLEWAGEDKSSASLVIETLVDGVPIANFSIVATDLYQLALSTQGDGEYQILNCWCGLPECARLSGGIHVQHPDSAVQWIVTLSAMSRGERPAVQRFVFRREQYVEAIKKFAKELAEEQKRERGEGGRGRGVVLYSEHRSIQEGGIEEIFRHKRAKKAG